MTQPLPLSKRTTASVAVFACLTASSPAMSYVSAQTLTVSPIIIAALNLQHAQLFSEYREIIHQDTANNEADLDAAIVAATATVTELNTTVQSITSTNWNQPALASIQEVVYSALQAMIAAQAAPDAAN